MYCQKCGKEIADGSAFCSECGTPLGTEPVQNIAPQKPAKKRRPGKIILGIVILLVGICILAEVFGGSGKTPAVNNSPASNAETSKINGKAKITKAEFDSISTGMSYEDAIAIIGGEGELMSEVNVGDGSTDTKIYVWYGDGSTNANLTFQGGKVVAKAQIGLE